MCSYLAHYAGELSYATLARRLVSISLAHKALGFESPASSEMVHRVMSGIARTHGRRQRKVKPLTVELLLQIFAKKDYSLKGIRDRALLLTGFAGGFRRSELVGLNWEDVKFKEEGVFLILRKSKTDQEGLGRTIPVPHVEGPLCPHCSLLDWLHAQGEDCDHGHDCHGNNHHGGNIAGNAVGGGDATRGGGHRHGGGVFRSLVHGRPGGRLSTEAVAILVKEHVKRIGLEPKDYSGHSLRAGFITSAAMADVALWQIKRVTGHKSLNVLEGYIREEVSMQTPLAKMLGN